MCMGPRNWCQGMNSASLCSLAGRYENPIPPRCLAPRDFLKIPALANVGGGGGRGTKSNTDDIQKNLALVLLFLFFYLRGRMNIHSYAFYYSFLRRCTELSENGNLSFAYSTPLPHYTLYTVHIYFAEEWIDKLCWSVKVLCRIIRLILRCGLSNMTLFLAHKIRLILYQFYFACTK